MFGFMLLFFTIWNCTIGPLIVAPLVKLILRREGGMISPVCICPHWIVGIVMPYYLFGVFGVCTLVLPAYCMGVAMGLGRFDGNGGGGGGGARAAPPGRNPPAPTVNYSAMVDLLNPAPANVVNAWLAADAGDCGICMDAFDPTSLAKPAVEFPCTGRHRYHRDCLQNWVVSDHGYGQTPTCPSCRTALPSRDEILRIQREDAAARAEVSVDLPTANQFADMYKSDKTGDELIF